MSETKTIARPYANASFEVAKTDGQTEDWLLFLEAAATVVQAGAMLNLVKSPTTDKEVLTKTIFSISNKASGLEPSADRMNFCILYTSPSQPDATLSRIATYS